MKKRLLAAATAAVMAASLVACGNSSAPQTTDAAATTAAGTTATTAAEAKDTTTQAAAEEGKTLNVTWVSCSTQSEFWQYQEIGIRNAALDMKDKYGVTVNVTTVGPATEAETEGYIRAFENAIASKPDIIISATQVPDSTRNVSKEAMDQGIVVNFTNCGLETLDSTEFADCYNQFYTTVSADVGDMAGKVMLEKLEEAGIPLEGVIAMEFSNVNPALQPRMDNFKAYVEANAPGIKVLDTLYNNNDLEQAQADIENQISTHGEKLIGIYGANNISGDGIALAVENAGIADKVITIGVDSDPTEIAALEAGNLDVIIVQDAYGQGYAAMQNAVETVLQGANPETEQKIAMAPVAVTTENMHEDTYAALLDPTVLRK